ncbi:MAG: LamG-like jellyroll fold domain-containing protein [Verrucomicrobiota bacterium]
MKIHYPWLLAAVLSCAAQIINAETPAAVVPDPRHLSNGWNIPSEGYADQPYIVKTDDAAWLCVMTTGKGVEGAGGQHVVSMRSTDRGRTWSEIVPIEPAAGPEASYAVLLKVPGGRIYAFYNHNTDRVPEVKREDKGVYKRVDSLGHYVFKYSDDHGRTWSAKRYEVELREFECDRNNAYGGKLRFFWNVGRPLIVDGTAMLVIHKVGAMGDGFFAQSEGAFFSSRNILSERDPAKINFTTLPDGEIGLRTPPGGGRVAEEQSIVKLSDGSLYCVYRTIDGWPTCAYSRDHGHTWTTPAYKTYSPGGRRVKHPRAANFAWNCSNGKFLYWFHNHGGRFVGELGANGKGGRSPYDDRNPAWLMAGREVDTPQGKCIEWSQPEILLYDDDPFIRMSYPDLVEDDGKYFITETQKTIGRAHEIPKALVEGLFNQFTCRAGATNGLIGKLPAGQPAAREVTMPKLPEFHRRNTKSEDQRGQDLRAGFSLDVWLKLDSLKAGQVLLDSRTESGQGILLATTESGTLRLTLNDGRQETGWDCDRGVIQADKLHHVVATVDSGPKIITFVVDGVLCDGGDQRQFGWGRFSPTLRAPNGASKLQITATIQGMRLYNRALRTSEAVGNFRAGPVW